MSENEVVEDKDLACLFCREVKHLVIYWLPDSEPEVCHVACCKCGSAGSWEESSETAITNYRAATQLITRLTEALAEVLNSGVEFDGHAGYVVMQVDRDTLAQCRDVLAVAAVAKERAL